MILPIDSHDRFTRNLMRPGAVGSAVIHTVHHGASETVPDTAPVLRDLISITSRGGWRHREPAIGAENIATGRGPAMIGNRPAAGPAGMHP